MQKSFDKLILGYETFRQKYIVGDSSIMKSLAMNGQKPSTMVVACCDSRVDPALILQSDPGDLFVVRNVANIVPPYIKDKEHHGTSAALEFAICFLGIKHLILLGHSKCGGIEALLNSDKLVKHNDFIANWVSIIKPPSSLADEHHTDIDDYAKFSLHLSYENCLTFPWIREKLQTNQLMIHLWFFDIEQGEILSYCEKQKEYVNLEKFMQNELMSV